MFVIIYLYKLKTQLKKMKVILKLVYYWSVFKIKFNKTKVLPLYLLHSDKINNYYFLNCSIF